ncbi:MAG TPA: NADH-quinone oxidoreductase subunit N [Bryobacteraceae bacterium]|nr:NADH-quinone oxidoreductase subunit N [Bryobacteraceae bacterium]
MPDSFFPAGVEYIRFLPEIILTIAGTLIMLLEPFLGDGKKSGLGVFALISLLAAIPATALAGNNPGYAFSHMLLVDGFATFFRYVVIGVGVLCISASFQYLRRENQNSGEYYALLLFSVTGQCVMAASNELIMIFIGLEISSIASYVLAGYLRDDKRNNEAALKYFLLGSFATAFLLYGIAWIYGITGATNLDQIRYTLLNHDIEAGGVLVGVSAALMFVGFAFKVSAAPFQVWAPDVYQGAPAPVSAFLSTGPKAAAFAIFLRVYMTAFGPISNRWEAFVWISALLTMIVGNFGALRQPNLKRMLGYSSVAHAGYVMVAIAAHSQIGVAAAMFYLAAYAFMQIGCFAVVAHFARQGEKYVNIEDLAGLGWKQPVTAGLFTLFLLSLIGIPLTGGFFGKFYIFKAAVDSNLIWLAILGALNSAVAAYYYLRVLVVMYMKEPGDAVETSQPMAPGISFTLWASALGTLLLGIFPSAVLDFVRNSSSLAK